MKKTQKLLIAILVLLLIAALAVTGILLWPKETAGDNTDSGTGFVIESYPIIPTAYLNQEYDLRDAIEIEEGVTYSATALYVDYNNGMTEHEVPVNDLKLIPVDLFELVVTITAQKGEQTAQKVLYIPVSIIADPIDQTFSSKGSAAWADDGIVKTVTINPDYIKAENSFTALEISFNGASSEYYGTTLGILTDSDLMDLYTDQVWENAVLQFWVYNPMEAPVEFQLRIKDNMTGLNTEWDQDDDFPYKQIAQPGQWTLCVFSLRAQGTIHRLGNKEGLYLKCQYHGMPGLDINYSYSFVMDGLDIVDASNYPDLDTTFTKSTETLDQGWENMPLDTGWQGTETIYDHEIMMGEGSVCSLKAVFSGPKGLKEPFVSFAPQWAVAYGKMRELPDMSGGTLTAYFKFENMPAHAELNLTNREWETTNTLPFTMKKLDNGWYEGTIDLYDLEFAAAGRSDNIIRFNIRFPNASKNSVVYIDTMKFTYKEVNKVKEAATKDWINLPVDSGMNALSTYKYSTSKLKAPGSVRSVYAKAKSNANGAIVFSQEWGVRYKTLSSLPDMRSGVLHAYFYFGSQTPKATAQIFNKEWGNSTDVSFVFESVGNGWYYGSIPCTLFKGYERGNSKDIIRIEIGFPAGYSVYIDGLMHNPNETFSQNVNLEDLLGSGLVSVGNLTAKGGSKVVTDVTNNSKDAMYIYATGDTNYPLLTSRFVQPVDASAWDNLSFDMLADNASTWVGMRVYYLDDSGKEQTASVGTDITAGAWNTVAVDLSAFKNVNWKKVTGFGLQFNMDKEDGGLKTGTNKIYIDNWMLTKDPELPADPEDLLGDATLSGGSFQSNPALYKAENDVTVKNGTTSTRSWKFSVKEKAWPTAQFTFANVLDLTDKSLQFDVKLNKLASSSDPFERIDVILLGANGAALHDYILNKDIENGMVTANADGWYTITLDLTELGIDRTAVYGIQFRFNFDEFEAIYVDNMKVVDQAEAEPEPELPADPDDLLGDATLTGGSFYSNPALYEADNDLTVKNGATSTRSWKFSVNEKAWPTAQFTFANVLDLTDKSLQFDVKLNKLASSSDPFERIDVILLGANGAALHDYILNKDIENGTVTANADGWYTITLDLTELGIDRTAVYGIQFRFNFDEFEAIYVDNMKVVDQAEAEPEPELPADPDDLLGDATLTGGSFHSNPALYQAENDVTVKNGATSTRSWKFSVKEKAWPTGQFTFANVQDLTDKTVQFDIKFAPLANVADPFERIDVMLLGANGASLHAYINNVDVDNGTVTANADGWYTITLDLTTLDIDRTAVHGIQFRFNFDQFEAIYIDNVKLAEQAEAEPEPELPADPDDLLGDATLTGGSFYSNTSLYISENDQTVKNGATSTRSWKFSVTEKSWPTAQFTFANAQDLTGKTVQFDVKFVSLGGSDPLERIDVILLGANSAALHSYILNKDVEDGKITANADGWYTITLDLTDLDFDRSAVCGIQFRFNFDEFEAIYVDNMKLVVPSVPEPELPAFDPEDLIASSLIDPVSGLQVELVTDKTNGSDEALYIHANEPCGYPTVKLMFAEAQDISAFDNLSLDGAVETASKWIGLRLYYLDGEGQQKTANASIDLTGSDWSTHVVELSKFTGADLTKVVGFGLCLNYHATEGFVTGENNQMWIDNMKLTVNPAPDLNDLLADATMSGGHFVTDPDNYHLDTNSNVVNGAESTRSWKLSAASGWPQAFITFAEKLDLTNKALQFDVKFVEKAGKSNRWIDVYLLDSEGNKLFNSQPVDDCKDGSLTANADGWYTVTLNFGTLDFDRTAAATLYLCFDFDSVDEVYLDNMKLVDWTPPAPKPEFDPADVMPTSQITGITETNALKVTTVTNDTFHSDDAVKVTATAKSSWPVLKIMFEETQDLSDFTELTFAAKSVTASKWLGLRIYYLDANNEQKSANLGIDLSANDKWEHWFVPLSKFSGLDKSKVVGVGFCFNFDDGFVADQTNTVLIDAVGFCGSETVAQDWTNMRLDGGYSAGTYYMDISKAKAKDSVKSLKLEAPSGNAGIAALNPQWAVAEGTLAARPNLTAGTVGAWFYFGTQTPSAGLSVVNSGWAESNAAPFTFGAGENGWYYGTVDVSAITFDNATATAADCFRLCIEVPAGYSVYIDGMTYTKPAASEATEKASDLLATSVNAWPGGGFDGTKNVIDTECTDVYGDQSLYSWKLSTEGADGRNTWPVVQIRLGNAVDLTGKLIAFEVKFESTTARDHYWMSLKSVENSAWSAVTSGSIGKDIYSTDWVTVTFDPSQKLKSGCDLTDVLLLSLCFNFETAEPQAVYIDNLRLIDAQ